MSWSARDEEGTREFFDSAEALEKKVAALARQLRTARHGIVFSGAGLSTAAGIPDFRSGMKTVLPTGPGLWSAQADYERRTGGVRTEETKNDPTRPKVNLDMFLLKPPTYAHRAVGKLVEAGFIKTVMTQNVDNLHRRGGVPRSALVELHGNLQCEVCDACGHEFERDFRVGPNPGKQHYTGRQCGRMLRSGRGCEGWLRDYLIPFGEDLPKKETDKAWRESELADFCLVLGSSMTVTPACDYAGWVGRKTQRRWQNPPASTGALAIVNIQETPYDADAKLVIHSFCDDVMRKLMQELELDVPEEEDAKEG